jgi:hypothetical protein
MTLSSEGARLTILKEDWPIFEISKDELRNIGKYISPLIKLNIIYDCNHSANYLSFLLLNPSKCLTERATLTENDKGIMAAQKRYFPNSEQLSKEECKCIIWSLT